jgi:hypothetical protein
VEVALTDVKCRGARPGKVRQKLSDGGGLQLWIQPNGSRLWQLIYQYNGKQVQMALGPYGQDEMTSHGFRASASTLLNESGKWHPDAIERQLAHVESNDVRRAYSRGSFWDERIRMMPWWADYLDQLRTGAKITISESLLNCELSTNTS